MAVEPIDWTKGTAAQEILEGLKKKNDGDKSPVDFLMVAGDGRDDEVCFRWANELGESGYIKHVTTVSLGNRDTQAMKTLTQGVTGMSLALLFSVSRILTIVYNRRPHCSSETSCVVVTPDWHELCDTKFLFTLCFTASLFRSCALQRPCTL